MIKSGIENTKASSTLEEIGYEDVYPDIEDESM